MKYLDLGNVPQGKGNKLIKITFVLNTFDFEFLDCYESYLRNAGEKIRILIAFMNYCL